MCTTSSSISSRQFEIIVAAGKLLSTAGVSGLTIKNLAKEMQFTESAIYRHFASKEDIIVAMLNYLADDMDKRLNQLASTNDHSPRKQLEAIFSSQFAFFSANPHFVVAAFSDGLMEASPKINAAILRIIGIKTKHIMQNILEGQQTGCFTTAVPAESLIHFVMGAFRLQLFKWRIANFHFDLEQEGRGVLKSLLTVMQGTLNRNNEK